MDINSTLTGQGTEPPAGPTKRPSLNLWTALAAGVLLLAAASVGLYFWTASRGADPAASEGLLPPKPVLDRADYDRRMLRLANLPETPAGTAPKSSRWPVKAAYPEYGAILPFKRIIAYYGNFLSAGMGVLGEYPEDVMLKMLAGEIKKWEAADPATPVQPAVDYIAIVAQAGAGKDGKYRLRMPDKEIDKALAVAAKIDGIVILEVQPGLSDLMAEIRSLEKFLALPQVHLAIDPEFALKGSGAPPGTEVGTVDAKDVNAAAEYLAALVRENRLPPKVLIVHRYTAPMVTNATRIVPLAEVQIVMDMDGWGPPSQKYDSYQAYIVSEPVQFTGFKLFYKEDIKHPGSRLLTPAEVIKLSPRPSFTMYQ